MCGRPLHWSGLIVKFTQNTATNEKNSATVFILLDMTRKNRGEIGIQTILGFLFISKKLLEVKLNGNTFLVKCKFDKNLHNQKAVPLLVGSRSGKCFKGQTHAVASALF